MDKHPSQADYEHLLEFRTRLRRFLRWSEEQARDQNLTPAQHQLLLAIKGHRDPAGPSIGDVARCLLLQHHSVVGLVDRAEAAGLVLRERDAVNRSTVRLRLTSDAERRLEALSELHLEEVPRLAAAMQSLFAASEDPRSGARGNPHQASSNPP